MEVDSDESGMGELDELDGPVDNSCRFVCVSERGVVAATSAMMWKENVLPRPISVSTLMVPSNASINRLLMIRPNPVPPYSPLTCCT